MIFLKSPSRHCNCAWRRNAFSAQLEVCAAVGGRGTEAPAVRLAPGEVAGSDVTGVQELLEAEQHRTAALIGERRVYNQGLGRMGY